VRQTRGFTLIEIAVVLVIFGIIATAALRIATSALTTAGYRDTRQKMVVIKEALVGYLRANNRLPCPDTKSGFLNTPNPGTVSFSLSAPPDGIENRNQASGASLETKAACDSPFGLVPYATLGLSAETATDGFGNFFSYYLANGYGWSSSDADAQASMRGNVTINDYSTGIVSPQPGAVVVVLSYGTNGFGAWTTKGTSIAMPPTGTDEFSNANPSTSSPPTFVNRTATDDFDDVVMALSPHDLIGGYLPKNPSNH
jgi:prepilin-type N-terminal cleavage/methylation domain-containing protein